MTADTFSNTLGFLSMATGNDNNAWGSNCNTAVFQIFEDAIANALSSSVTGGTLDLSGSPPPSAASQVRYAALIFTGTLTGNQTVKVPNLTKWWWVNNQTSGAFTLVIKTPSGSASTAIPQNSGWQLVQCDGSNNIVVSPFNSVQIQMPDGSVSAPPYSDINETNSGWYRHGAGDWRLSILGADILQVTGSVVNVLSGSLQQAGVQVIPPGTELPYAGVALPAGFLWEFGQNVSRATYANLLAAMRISFTATFTNGSPSLTGTSIDLRNLGLEGAVIESATPGVTNLTASVIGSVNITMSGNATAGSGAPVTCYLYPFGNGDGTTTFTIPDRRGRVLAGRDNMSTTSGAAAAGRLTTGGSGIAGIQLAASGGAETESITIAQANLPNVNFTVSGITLNDTGHLHSFNLDFAAVGTSNIPPGAASGTVSSTANTNTATTGITISSQGHAASGGSGTAITVVTTQPTGITNFIIKT